MGVLSPNRDLAEDVGSNRYRVRGSRLTVLLFTTGKIVVAGARNEEDIRFAVKNLLEELEKHEIM
ncbi:hypothetical protein [Palaeococcus sp. (in: euryarchaeotes)]